VQERHFAQDGKKEQKLAETWPEMCQPTVKRE